MLKHKAEIILVIILIPILAYVIWQAYNSYFRQQNMKIEELEETAQEETTQEETAVVPSEPPIGILTGTGYAERDPLKPSLPVKEKIEKPPEPVSPAITPKEKLIKEKEPLKEIILPVFTITGIVWGKPQSRAIIDNEVHKIGDVVKGAKILDITDKGIKMIFEDKEFFVSVQRGG